MSLETIAALFIRAYQKYLSPHKGFRCAHRALHGGASCSEFARLYVLEHGVWAMPSALRLRIRECRMAKQSLNAAKMANAQGKKTVRTPLWCDICGGVGDASCGHILPDSCDATPDVCDCPCG